MGFCESTHSLCRHNLIEVKISVILKRERGLLGGSVRAHSLCRHNLIEMRSVSLKREDYYGVL